MVEALYPSTGQVLVSGGGARSPLWRQILADITGRELLAVNETEGAALGAALLAAVGFEAFPSVPAACGALVQVKSCTEPEAENMVRYDNLYAIYRDIYPALCSANHRLSDLMMK
jgi:xylulokinase